MCLCVCVGYHFWKWTWIVKFKSWIKLYISLCSTNALWKIIHPSYWEIVGHTGFFNLGRQPKRRKTSKYSDAPFLCYQLIQKVWLVLHKRGCPCGIMINVMDCGIVEIESLYSSLAITFTFREISLGKVWTPLSSHLWVK